MNKLKSGILEKTKDVFRELVTSDIGVCLLLTGWAIWLGNPLSFIGIAGFVLLMNAIQIKPEETALKKIFGQDYQAFIQIIKESESFIR